MLVRKRLVSWLNYREILVDFLLAHLAEELRCNPEGRGSIPNGIVEINH
jgi:hypothetical protein